MSKLKSEELDLLSEESLSVVRSILDDVIDNVVDGVSTNLILEKAKTNIATEIKSNPERYIERFFEENHYPTEQNQDLENCRNKLLLYLTAEKKLYPMAVAFANKKFGTGAQRPLSEDDAERPILEAWTKYDKKYGTKTFTKYFEQQYEELSETEKAKLTRPPYEQWFYQNQRIEQWMLSEIQSVQLHDKTSLAGILTTAQNTFAQSTGENSEITLLLKIKNGQGDIEQMSRDVAEMRFQNLKEARRIVWMSTGQEDSLDEEGNPVTISDFKYSGKTAAKTVNIPYHDIQKAIIDANWTLRAGKGIASNSQSGKHVNGNYLTAHMLFVVSDQEHIKSRRSDRYEGGRSFVDFPIALPLDLMTTQRIFSNQKSFEIFLNSNGSEVGRNVSSSKPYAHSEWTLEEFLYNPENVKKIVEILNTKLTAKFGTAEGHKVYEVILFTNSNQNICDQHEQYEFGCEGKMWNLQASQSEGSFLMMLRDEMHNHGLKTPTKSTFPRMLVANTSFQTFSYQHKSSQTLSEDANTWIGGREETKKYDGLVVDAKALAGKVILTSTEISIDGKDRTTQIYEPKDSVDKKKYAEPESVPFYSGFTSRTGTRDLLGDKKNGKISTPKSFDDIDLIEVRKKPSKYPSATDLLHLGSMNISGKRIK